MLIFFSTMTIVLVIIIATFWLAAMSMTAHRKPDPPASPADHGLAFESVAFTSGDDLTLRGWYIPAIESSSSPHSEQPTESDRTIIICSGHNGSMDSDVGLAPWMHAAGFNVLMFDYRGHGRSEGHEVSMGTLEQRDLRAAVNFARSLGATHIGVLGLSMGGAVALATAADCPDIHAVCSDGGFARVSSVISNELLERGIPQPLDGIIASILVFVAGMRLGIDMTQVDPIRKVNLIAPRPVLYIHGALDRSVPVADVRMLYKLTREPKELWIVPMGKHRDIHKLEPERYRQRIVEFFGKTLAKTPKES